MVGTSNKSVPELASHWHDSRRLPQETAGEARALRVGADSKHVLSDRRSLRRWAAELRDLLEVCREVGNTRDIYIYINHTSTIYKPWTISITHQPSIPYIPSGNDYQFAIEAMAIEIVVTTNICSDSSQGPVKMTWVCSIQKDDFPGSYYVMLY